MAMSHVPHGCRFELAKASRVWRQGVPTAFVMDQSLHMLQDAEAVQVHHTVPPIITLHVICFASKSYLVNCLTTL